MRQPPCLSRSSVYAIREAKGKQGGRSPLSSHAERKNGLVPVDASRVSIWALSCLKRPAQPFSQLVAQVVGSTNVPMRDRGKRVEEFITAMRAAWGSDPVNYHGRFYQIPLSNNNPKPLQEGGVPILLGTFARAGIERAARLTDGLILIGFSAEQVQQTVSSLRTAAIAAGRDPSSLQIVVRVNVPITADPLPERDRPFLGGSAEQIAKDVEQLRPLAVDQVLFSDRSSPTVDDAMQRLAELQAALW